MSQTNLSLLNQRFNTVLIDNSSLGYYNNAIGDLYSSTLASYFPGPNVSTGDPKKEFPNAPNLNNVAALGNWLKNPDNPKGSWSKTYNKIPPTWKVNTETAIIYEIDAGTFDIKNVKGSFGADNGIYVWVNGKYKFGAMSPGTSILGEYQIELGDFSPGKNYIQILRADHGATTGFDIKVTGDKVFIHPTIDSILEDRDIKGDFVTYDKTLIFNGTAEPKSKIKVLINGNSIGTTTTDDSGKWSYDYTKSPLSVGNYSLTATATDSSGKVSNTSSAKQLKIIPDTHYNIDVDVTDSSIANNAPLKKRIKEAAKFWEGIIKDDIPDYNIGGSNFVDDLEIKFAVKYVDGQGNGKQNIIANTFNYKLRNGLSNNIYNGLPARAEIVIDSGDLNDILTTDYGLDTLKHEIAHAIGFNSLTFAVKGLVKNTGGHYGFTGTNALKKYKERGGFKDHKSVPLEDKQQPGHWHDWIFPSYTEEPMVGYIFFSKDELMTANISTKKGISTRLSDLTLAAFMDLGFTVDMSKGDSYKVDSGGLSYTNPLTTRSY